MTIWEFDTAVRSEGYPIVAGVDEAGRGPLCGPVCAAAVILPEGLVIEALNDSKKLTEKKREELFDVITEKAIAYGIGFASVEEIEDVNILNATYLAMCRAVEQLNTQPSLVLVDGNRTPKGLSYPSRTVIKGDALSASIAAASVLAKVSRDRLLLELDREYPQYGFAKHKGYGTAAHYDALREFGPCPAHRMSFLKKFFGEA
ncbi:MAG: ribonuclease HII [Clostridia bacterium]|nr:ribonuclease HII [Clostridia bacterium]